MNAAIQRETLGAIADARLKSAKASGKLYLEVDGISLSASRTPKTKWNQKLLQAWLAQLSEAGENPAEYMDIELSIPESRYKAWPASLQAIVANARTLDYSKETIKFEDAE